MRTSQELELEIYTVSIRTKKSSKMISKIENYEYELAH